MKKIISILFLFFICISCYFIYNITEKKEITYLLVGDSVANNPNLIKNNNNTYVDNDYRILDIANILKYNEEIDNVSLFRKLKENDIIILSIGMNDLYYKLNDNTKNIYTYLNEMLDNYKLILDYISKYNYKKVYVLGYYNITDKYHDLFTYTNYKLSRLAKEYNYNYLNLEKIFHNHPEYLQKYTNYYPNNAGYYQIYKLIVENFQKS